MAFEENNLKSIPSRFIYEMDEGTPIYYKGTRAFLENSSPNINLQASSNFQSWLKIEICYFFRSIF